MIRRILIVALAFAASMAALDVRAQQIAPRDLWPQAANAAADSDFEAADKYVADLLATRKTHGIETFPLYASAAAGLASESAAQKPEITTWAAKAANTLDANSPAVAFSEADRAARKKDWAGALRFVFKGFTRVFGNYRTNLLSRADLVIVAAAAIIVTAIVFAIALFIRYGRSMAHDFREMLSKRMSGGSVSVLAFALLFLPVFLWLGPMWLLFYWIIIFFSYAGVVERIAAVLLLLLVALVPVALDRAANRIAMVDGPVVMAAISSNGQSYDPESLRRLQELVTVVSDQPALHVLLGNLLTFEGSEDQAESQYRRATELNPRYAGAHVNLGNLLFFKNEFTAAINAYEKAEQADSKLAVAFYNHSVAAGETYKFDLQKEMLVKARAADKDFVERMTRNAPARKIVMYNPPLAEAWRIAEVVASRPAAQTLFSNYSRFDLQKSATNAITLGSAASLLLAVGIWLKRRRTGLANACIKCGRTFCHRCKSARESSTYCTQCIHIYLKRDGVSIDTKRTKLEEVGEHQAAMQRRNRLFATFLPGSAQMLEGRTITGTLGIFSFAVLVTAAIFVGRLAPALGPAADFAQLLVRVTAIILAVIMWLTWSLPVYRRRAATG